MNDLEAPTAFLFDLDGTLVDTVGTRVEAWLDTFPRFGIHPRRADLAPLMGSDGRWLARNVAERAGVVLEPGVDIEIDRLAGERFGELNAHPRPLPGAQHILAHLDAIETPWAIATSSRRDEVHASVAALRLSREPLVIDGSDVEHAKPAPDLLLKAAARLGLDSGGTWYVGDSRWDMLAAGAAGMVAVGVTTGATSEADLAASGASLTLPSLLELLSRIEDQRPR